MKVSKRAALSVGAWSRAFLLTLGVVCLSSKLATAQGGQGEDISTTRVKRIIRMNPYENPSSFRSRYTIGDVQFSGDGSALVIGSMLYDELNIDRSSCEPVVNGNCPDRSLTNSPRGLPTNLFRFPVPSGDFPALEGEQLNVTGGISSQFGTKSTDAVPVNDRGIFDPSCLSLLVDDPTDVEPDETATCTRVLASVGDGYGGVLYTNATIDGISPEPPFNVLQLPAVLYFYDALDGEVSYTALDPSVVLQSVIFPTALSATVPEDVPVAGWRPVFAQVGAGANAATFDSVLVVFEVLGNPVGDSASFSTTLGYTLVLFDTSDVFDDDPSRDVTPQLLVDENGRPFRVADPHALINETGDAILFKEEPLEAASQSSLTRLERDGGSWSKDEVDVPSTGSGRNIFLGNATRDFSRVVVVTNQETGYEFATFPVYQQHEQAGVLGADKRVELHSFQGEGLGYTSQIVSSRRNGTSLRSCYDNCFESVLDVERCASICTSSEFSNNPEVGNCLRDDARCEESFPPDLEGGNPVPDDFLVAKRKIQTEFAWLTQVGPGAYGVTAVTDGDQEKVVLTFPINSYLSDGNIPARGVNLFARVLSGDGELDSGPILLTPRESGLGLNAHARYRYLRASLSPQGDKVAFLAKGQIGRFKRTRAQVFVAELSAQQAPRNFKKKAKGVRDTLNEQIQDEEFKPVFEAPPAETPRARGNIEIPTTFIQELYDSIIDQELNLKKRFETKLENFLGILESLDVEISASKSSKATVRFRVRVQRLVTKKDGTQKWKTIKKGVSRTKTLNKFKLPKLSSGTYRARYKTIIKRSSNTKGTTTSFSSDSDAFEIVR